MNGIRSGSVYSECRCMLQRMDELITYGTGTDETVHACAEDAREPTR